MQLLGIDIGTTSVCAVVMDADTGAVLCSKTVNSEAFIPTQNSWEKLQSPEKLLRIGRTLADELITEETAAIGVTGQMHGIVYTDENGCAISPLYTWQDGRGDQPYRDTTYAKFLGSCSGYGNVTDFYNRQNGLRPENAVSYCTIQDLLVMNLCRLKRPLIHATNAASFGCYDLQTNRFRYPLDVVPVTDFAVAGAYRGIPVAVAIGDNQASVFSCLAEDGQLLLNVGTGSQVSVVSEKVISGANIEARPYFSGKYLIAGSALCGGRAYSMLKDFFAAVLDREGENVYERMDKLLSCSDGTLQVDTRFAGTRENHTLTGSITGITTQNFTPGNLCRGVLAGMAEELYSLYKLMGVSCSSMVGAGNGLRKNRHFIKEAEARFGMDIQIPAHVEEAACGAALYAAVSAKICDDVKALIRFL